MGQGIAPPLFFVLPKKSRRARWKRKRFGRQTDPLGPFAANAGARTRDMVIELVPIVGRGNGQRLSTFPPREWELRGWAKTDTTS